MTDLRDFINKMPKVELHAHLSGSLSVATMAQLLAAKKVRGGDWKGLDPDDFADHIAKLAESRRDITSVFQLFRWIQVLTDCPLAVKKAAMDVIAEFNADGVVYLELRTTARCEVGMSKEEYVGAVVSGIRASAALPIRVRLLVSIDRKRGVAEAEENLELFLRLRPTTHELVGIDLSGDPTVDARPFLPILRRAKAAKVPLATHLCEIPSMALESEELLLLPPERVGHATFLRTERGGSPIAQQLVRDGKICIEVCPTSNLISGTVETYGATHFGPWFAEGHPVVLCTDDKGVFETSLSAELWQTAEAVGLGKVELGALTRNAIDAAFADAELKADLHRQLASYLAA